MSGLDELDLKILKILKKDSRKSFRSIGRELGTATATIINRIKALEKSKIIQGYVVDIDYEKLGYDIVALIELSVSNGKQLEVEKEISKIPNVFGVYDLTGEYDAVVLARFKSKRELNSMIKSLLKMEHVDKTNTHLILDAVKEGSGFV